MSFSLHPRLDQGCIFMGELPLCRILLVNNALFPWFLLVPRRDGIREVYELNADDQIQLNIESTSFGKAIMNSFNGDKLNVGALGNMVPQLHIHHIVRYDKDLAWPGAIWGHDGKSAYTPQAIDEMRNQITALDLAEYIPA